MYRFKFYFIVTLLTALLFSCKESLTEQKEVTVINAYLDTIIQDWEGQDEFIAEFNRLTDTKLNITQPAHQQYMDKLMVSFSEVNSPDICEILPEYLSTFITTKTVLSLNDLIDKSKYVKDFDKNFLNNYRDASGNIYGFPTRDGGGCVTYIRKDWLDNLNLDIPTTWNEFYNVMYQFTYGDPDGNGYNDTKGYTDVNSASEDWYNRAVMLDSRVEIYYKNGIWVDGFTEPGMIDALKRLKQIYQEGLTDSNITNNTTFTARNRFINGEVGIITYWANHWARNLKERTSAISGDQTEIVAIPSLAGGHYIKRVAPLLVIPSSAKNPEAVFTTFIDKQYDKAEMQTLFTYGVKDYHFEIIDGEYRFKINKNDPYEAPFTKSFVPPVSILNNWDQPMIIDDTISPAIRVLNSFSVQDKLKIGGVYYSQYYIEIEKLKPEIISRIINGELTIDEGIDQYIKKSKSMYIERVLRELNGKS